MVATKNEELKLQIKKRTRSWRQKEEGEEEEGELQYSSNSLHLIVREVKTWKGRQTVVAIAAHGGRRVKLSLYVRAV